MFEEKNFVSNKTKQMPVVSCPSVEDVEKGNYHGWNVYTQYHKGNFVPPAYANFNMPGDTQPTCTYNWSDGGVVLQWPGTGVSGPNWDSGGTTQYCGPEYTHVPIDKCSFTTDNLPPASAPKCENKTYCYPMCHCTKESDPCCSETPCYYCSV